MKNIEFLSENFQFLVVKFSIDLNRRVFVKLSIHITLDPCLSTEQLLNSDQTILIRRLV